MSFIYAIYGLDKVECSQFVKIVKKMNFDTFKKKNYFIIFYEKIH